MGHRGYRVTEWWWFKLRVGTRGLGYLPRETGDEDRIVLLECWAREIINIPFCLFFRLVRVCSRAPSSGAKGWRTMVAMAKSSLEQRLADRRVSQNQLQSIAAVPGPVPSARERYQTGEGNKKGSAVLAAAVFCLFSFPRGGSRCRGRSRQLDEGGKRREGGEKERGGRDVYYSYCSGWSASWARYLEGGVKVSLDAARETCNF